MTPESVDELAALQRQILDTVHTYVKPNGVLVYSTCTIDEAENEDNVRWFIEKHPEFELDKSFAEGTGMKQILPGEHGSDGFFIARFIKVNYDIKINHELININWFKTIVNADLIKIIWNR